MKAHFHSLTYNYWSQAVQPYHASDMSVTLTTNLTTFTIQAIHPRLPFIGWYCSCIPN